MSPLTPDQILADARKEPGIPLNVERCDRIVNSGTGEPTECGRTWPCEYHDPIEDAATHLSKYGCNVFHDVPCVWQRLASESSPAEEGAE